jgi:Bardet-Biedl syndrome 2 protein
VQIRVSDMELAGDLVQDLCRYLNLDELESTATFPEDMEQLKGVLMRVTDYNAQRMKMTADMADVSQRVKSLIVKAEDNRILGAMQVGCESPPQR